MLKSLFEITSMPGINRVIADLSGIAEKQQ